MLELPLPYQAVEILQAIPRRPGRDLVFGTKGPFSGFSRCKKRLDIRLGYLDKEGNPVEGKESWDVHDIRRTVQTELHELGVSSDVTERILNHKRRGVQQVYDRAKYREPKRKALQRWADHLTAEPTSTVVDFVARSA